MSLQVLYKLKTAKFLDANNCHGADANDFPFAVQHLMLCVDSRLLCVAGVSHVILLHFSKLEAMGDCTVCDLGHYLTTILCSHKDISCLRFVYCFAFCQDHFVQNIFDFLNFMAVFLLTICINNV